MNRRLIRRLAFAALAVVALMLLTAADSCTSKAVNQNSKSDSEVNQKMEQVQLGMSEESVRAILGKPNHTQEQNTEGYKSDCWYYGSSDSWQLCFDNGLVDHHPMALTSKNRY